MKHERVFGIREHLRILRRAASSLVFVRKQKKRRLMNKKFKERIMLAVTEVNGCQFCSFVHTKLSLQAGMSMEEIRNILNGNLEEITDEELVAVLYGQHYADSHETPDAEALRRLQETYGVDRANIIQGFTEVITFTNSLGIAFNLLKDRLTFKRHKDSRFLNELLVILSSMLLFPLFVIVSLFTTKKYTNKELAHNS